jgi:hypothetical protein
MQNFQDWYFLRGGQTIYPLGPSTKEQLVRVRPEQNSVVRFELGKVGCCAVHCTHPLFLKAFDRYLQEYNPCLFLKIIHSLGLGEFVGDFPRFNSSLQLQRYLGYRWPGFHRRLEYPKPGVTRGSILPSLTVWYGGTPVPQVPPEVLAVVVNKFESWRDDWVVILLFIKHNLSYHLSTPQILAALRDLTYIQHEHPTDACAYWGSAVSYYRKHPFGADPIVAHLLAAFKPPRCVPPGECTPELLAYIRATCTCSLAEAQWAFRNMIPTTQVRKYKILFDDDLLNFTHGPGGRRHWEQHYPFAAALWHAAPPGGNFRRFFGTHDVVFERCWNMAPRVTLAGERAFRAAVGRAKQNLKALLLHPPERLNLFLRQHRNSLAAELTTVQLPPDGAFVGPFSRPPALCLRLWSPGSWVQLAGEFYQRRGAVRANLGLPSQHPPDRLDLSEFVRYLVRVISYSKFDTKKVSKVLVDYWNRRTYATVYDLYAFRKFLKGQTLILT